MIKQEFRKLRIIYVKENLQEKKEINIIEQAHHYLRNVIRLRKKGVYFRVFNANDGEYLASIEESKIHSSFIIIKEKLRSSGNINQVQNITYCVSITKSDSFNKIIDSLTQIGIKHIIPIISDNSQYQKINQEKL